MNALSQSDPSTCAVRAAHYVAETGERYQALLIAAAGAATRITATPGGGLTGSAAYIHRASRELLAAIAEPQRELPDGDEAVFECLTRLQAAWPDIAAGRIAGEQLLASEPGLWKRAMSEWPMGGFARMAADFMIDRELLGGNVVELGAGVGSCTALVADHLGVNFVRSDLQPFLLRRQKVPGGVARYDFNEPGPWRGLDTIFAVNALHCARDKLATLRHLVAMLRNGGILVLGEGHPVTDERGTPWALNGFFGLYRGWWDIGGFLPRETWLAAFAQAGFADAGYAAYRAGDHDLGGLLWAVK